jgi:hypothetical protein
LIYARVPRDGVVLVFDANGAFVRRLGGRGMGPGEFQNASGHGFVGDTLVGAELAHTSNLEVHETRITHRD